MLFSYLLEIYQMDLRRNSRKDVIFFFLGGGEGNLRTEHKQLG